MSHAGEMHGGRPNRAGRTAAPRAASASAWRPPASADSTGPDCASATRCSRRAAARSPRPGRSRARSRPGPRAWRRPSRPRSRPSRARSARRAPRPAGGPPPRRGSRRPSRAGGPPGSPASPADAADAPRRPCVPGSRRSRRCRNARLPRSNAPIDHRGRGRSIRRGTAPIAGPSAALAQAVDDPRPRWRTDRRTRGSRPAAHRRRSASPSAVGGVHDQLPDVGARARPPRRAPPRSRAGCVQLAIAGRSRPPPPRRSDRPPVSRSASARRIQQSRSMKRARAPVQRLELIQPLDLAQQRDRDVRPPAVVGQLGGGEHATGPLAGSLSCTARRSAVRATSTAPRAGRAPRPLRARAQASSSRPAHQRRAMPHAPVRDRRRARRRAPRGHGDAAARRRSARSPSG